MITQLLRRVEKTALAKQKKIAKYAKKYRKKLGRSILKTTRRIQRVNKKYLEKAIANSLAIKTVGYATLFFVISAGYQPSSQVVDATWKSNLKFDTTKAMPVVLPEKSVDIKVVKIDPPKPAVVTTSTTKSTTRNTTARERALKVTTTPAPVVTQPTVNVAEGTIKAYAEKRSNELFGAGHFSALVTLWNHESGWNYRAYNGSSGACGIPQALPCSKGGANFRNDPYKQIEWGLSYIAGRYGNPSNALYFWNNHRWY